MRRSAQVYPLLRPGGVHHQKPSTKNLPSTTRQAHTIHPSLARAQTCNFDVLYAYLTCGNYDFNYDRSKNLRPKRNIRTAMNHEVMMYAIAQKEQLGFDKAVEECKYRM